MQQNRSSSIVVLRILQLLLLPAVTRQAFASEPLQAREGDVARPNILLIMADDLGYADIGCFGSEIETPNIDRLASEGLKFTRFRATPMCVTSRIALMAGMPMHAAGQHGYRHSIPLASLLKSGGYRTLMTGKWHAGSPDPRSPDLFDRAFGFLGGATDSFVGGKDWYLNGKPFRLFPKGFYSSHAFAERSVEFMRESVERQEPFFMYVAFNAPHHPCQAPKATVEKYRDTYRRGYQVLCSERRQKQVQLGLVDPEWPLAPVGHEVRQWSELSSHRQGVEAERMAAYAAAVDEVDHSIGRMLKFLDESQLSDNTLVVFLSDNGGDYSNGAIESDEWQTPWKAGTNPSSSNGWASVKCTPFRYYKHSSHEGGIATPLVMRWPAGIRQPNATVIDVPTSITDLYPTLMQLAGINYPRLWQGKKKRELSGRSLLPLLTKQGIRKSEPVFQWYTFSKAWIEDEWKAVSLYDGPWQLFNLNRDRCEARDLAKVHPDRLDDMIGKWITFASESDVPQADRPSMIIQHGWGWHRLQMTTPQLISVSPENGAVAESTSIKFSLTFAGLVTPMITKSRTIRIFDVSDESHPVWSATDAIVANRPDGNSVSFDGPPELKPDHHYAVRWDNGWATVNGKPIRSLNDGSYWWRFRTPALPDD